MNNKSLFIDACLRIPTERTPIWLMRQAGRYMKEYREIREKVDFLTLCKTPELAAEITILPVKKLKVDAAILFSDLLIPLEAMGASINFGEEGPIIDNPLRRFSDIENLIIPNPEEKMPFVIETIKILRESLKEVPLIGFAGAPFTLATYLIEGKNSKDFIITKKMMFQESKMFHTLLKKLTETIISYLNAQIKAGVQAIQIFDTWAGVLSPSDYEEFAFPYTKKIIEKIDRINIPVILYINGISNLLPKIKRLGVDVVSIDWRVDIDVAKKELGDKIAIQGNLDPAALFLPKEELELRVLDIINRVRDTPGHIFNLGHGILPETPYENVLVLVEAVKKFSKRHSIKMPIF